MPEEKKILKVVCPTCSQKLEVTGLKPFSRIDCPSCKGEVIVPRRFDELLLEEPIGAGGMASVYRALDMTLDREVAVKILNESIVKSPDRSRLFLNEARSAAAVNHPNVVPIYSCGEFDDQPYLVMQYMGGLSLDRSIDEYQGSVPIDLCLRVAIGTARGLDAAYRHGIIHHDVKPGNILMDPDENIKIGDFGLAQICRDETAPSIETLVKSWVSPHYVSPEKVIHGKEDYRGDIYSLGATLYHLAAGFPPFPGKDSREIVFARTNGERPKSPGKIRSGIPPELSKFILRLMAFERDERPQGYDTIIDTFESLRNDWNSSPAAKRRKKKITRKTPGIPRLKVPAQAVAGAPLSRARKSTPPPDKLAHLVNLGIVGCLAVLVVLAVVAVKQRPPWYVDRVEPRLRRIREQLPFLPRPTIPRAGASQARIGAATAVVAPATAPAETWSSRPGDAERPQPPDLDFIAVKADLQAYLEQLPEEARALEKERILTVSQSRAYLIKLMKYLPYSGDQTSVKLRDGTSVAGSVPFCNEQQIAVRPRDGGELQHLSWEEIAFEQYVAFFDFYIRTRLGRTVDPDATGITAQQRREVAGDCLRVALLCDWYGQPVLAAKYVGMAQEYDPLTAGPRIVRLLPGLRPPAK